ncbi:MAG TPA: type II toxin-antitoxin system RelE/ParE family toxin [Pirellulales bacterium]|nr:type II toxin-antitoxin system RelE/ParE family toxin [Pirellulales bacterium]
MNLRWTQSALSDLEALEAYISRHSTRYARGMVERIFDHAGLLENHPLLGAVAPEYSDESIRELLEKPYRIIYRVLPDRIDVLAVIHAARTMPGGL